LFDDVSNFKVLEAVCKYNIYVGDKQIKLGNSLFVVTRQR